MDLRLPTAIASRQDVTRAHRELRTFTDLVMQSIMRHDNPVKYPAISGNLRALAVENQIDLRNEEACNDLLKRLEYVKLNAPNVHISFPTDPSQEVLQKLVTWLRKEIEPNIVIQVGLQPTIAAGIVLQTPNHQFDFSLRQHLYKNRGMLKEAISSGQ